MAKKLTYEYVKNYIESFKYELISTEYKNSSSKITVKCDEGHKYDVKFNDFKTGYRCKICAYNKLSKEKTFTYEYVKNYIEKEGYALLSNEYRGSNEYVTVTCPEGHVYDTTFSNFKAGFRCATCKNVKKKSYKEIKDEVELRGYEIITLENEYKNVHTKITLKCPEGHIYKTKCHVFLGGCKCPYCSELRIDYDYVKNFIENEGYELMSKVYENNRKKLDLRCPKGHRFELSFNKFKNGIRCNICRASSGEQKIMNYLDSKNIGYKFQHYLKGCKYKKPLPFDFYLPEYNICIEYDGEDHYHVINRSGCTKEECEEKFAMIQIRDGVKTSYCNEKNIGLIRIPYFNFNDIEKILDEKIV